MNWESKTIDELCTLVTDGAHYSPKEVVDGFPMASSKDMLENDFDFSDIKKISETDYHKLVAGNCKPLIGDVLIIKDGNSYLKNIFCIKEEKEMVLLSSIAILRTNQDVINPNFFQYALRNPIAKKRMENYVSGAAIPRIVLKDFKRMPLNVPNFDTQQKIASILSAYDDLIENNLKRIKLLEEAAQNIYKEWFVHFRFPNYENTSINEETGLPERWEIDKVENIISIIKGKKPKVELDAPTSNSVLYLLIDVLERKEIRFAENENLRLAEEGETLMLMDGSRSGLVFRAMDGAIGSTLAVFCIKNSLYTKNYIYHYFKDREREIISKNTGSAIPHANKSYICQMEIPRPSEKIASDFENCLNPLHNQIKNLFLQNQKLKEARDILLPRLMNRTIEV